MEKIIYFEDKELENEERKKDLDSSINITFELFKRIEELEKQNARLFNINREIINAKRNLRPKKAHSGYVLKGIRQRDFKFYGNRLRIFSYTLETPYSSLLNPNLVLKKIKTDFENRILNELGIEKAIIIENIEQYKKDRKKEILYNLAKDEIVIIEKVDNELQDLIALNDNIQELNSDTKREIIAPDIIYNDEIDERNTIEQIDKELQDLMASDEDLLLEFKLATNNNKVWNVEFFSKKVLEINMSLY